MENVWKFDNNIASKFVDHARGHIPNYDQVLDLTVDLCSRYPKDSAVIDVGCATGETLRRLSTAGFTNIWGVDNSAAMVQYCNCGNIIVSEEFPEYQGQFKVIIINWTLHFINNRREYLEKALEFLEPDGMLIISNKMDARPLAIEYYHNYKRQKGVSEEEIEQKARSLQGVMFVDDLEWHTKTFKELGLDYYLANAHWSFATFVCQFSAK